MIKIENTHVSGFEQAIRGMRNPMNSWDKSDSKRVNATDFKLGSNDFELMSNLAAAGPVHAKYRRMITVWVDITAPLYFWKEFDTYKVGTVSNSCSTMHKIAAKEFTLDDFSHEHLNGYGLEIFKGVIDYLNLSREVYVNGLHEDEEPMMPVTKPKDINWWWQMIQMLPSSYNQRRTIMLNYEVLANMYHYRKEHKLDEWRDLCEWIKTLPVSEIITVGRKE